MKEELASSQFMEMSHAQSNTMDNQLAAFNNVRGAPLKPGDAQPNIQNNNLQVSALFADNQDIDSSPANAGWPVSRRLPLPALQSTTCLLATEGNQEWRPNAEQLRHCFVLFQPKTLWNCK